MFLTCGDVEANVLHTIDATQGNFDAKIEAHQPLKSKAVLCHFSLPLGKRDCMETGPGVCVPANLPASTPKRSS